MDKQDQISDDAILKTMLAMAERLCAREDQLMQPQYRHLKGRITALIQLRSVSTLDPTGI